MRELGRVSQLMLYQAQLDLMQPVEKCKTKKSYGVSKAQKEKKKGASRPGGKGGSETFFLCCHFSQEQFTISY